MIVAALFFSLAVPSASSGTTVLARNVAVSQPVGRVVAVLSNVQIDSRVSGDVIVWGGDVSFGPSGFVDGNLSIFWGNVRVPRGNVMPVRGTVSTPGTLLHLYLAEMRRAPWEESSGVSTLRGLRLIALSAWLAVSLTLLYVFSSPFARAAASTERDFSGTLLAGALGILTLFLAAGAALALLPAPLSVPIAVSFGALAVTAKVFGMGALFLLTGQKLLKTASPARRPVALVVGFAVIAGISLFPLVGAIVWSAASIVAVGIAFLSRFGTPRFRVALP